MKKIVLFVAMMIAVVSIIPLVSCSSHEESSTGVDVNSSINLYAAQPVEGKAGQATVNLMPFQYIIFSTEHAESIYEMNGEPWLCNMATPPLANPLYSDTLLTNRNGNVPFTDEMIEELYTRDPDIVIIRWDTAWTYFYDHGWISED